MKNVLSGVEVNNALNDSNANIHDTYGLERVQVSKSQVVNKMPAYYSD